MKNQRGFSLVEGLLLFVLVGIIGGAGWYVYNSNKQANESLKNADASSKVTTKDIKANKEAVNTDETEQWISFTPDSKIYTIKIPDGWKLAHQNDECDCLFSSQLNYTAGTRATIEKTQGGRGGPFGFFISVDESNKSGERFKDYQMHENQGVIKVDGIEGTKYFYEEMSEQQGMGLEKGGKQYSYYFLKDGKGIYIAYTRNPSETNNLELFEKTVKTLQF